MSKTKYIEENETTEMWKEHRKIQQQKHRNWYDKNMAILIESCLIFTQPSDECVCFRLKKKADFYPSTGRWRDLSTGKTKSGGAKRFLEWYNK